MRPHCDVTSRVPSVDRITGRTRPDSCAPLFTWTRYSTKNKAADQVRITSFPADRYTAQPRPHRSSTDRSNYPLEGESPRTSDKYTSSTSSTYVCRYTSMHIRSKGSLFFWYFQIYDRTAFLCCRFCLSLAITGIRCSAKVKPRPRNISVSL